MRLLMASLDEETDVSVHERDSHGNVRSVREDTVLMGTLLLDATSHQIYSHFQSRDKRPVATYKLKM